MITIDLKKFRLSLTFGFFFVLALTTLRDNTVGTLSLLFCIAHELGHLTAMRIFGIKLRALRFYGAGIKITADSMDTLSKPAQAVIYLAGPLANLLFAFLFHGDTRALNLALAVFNLMPISYFDGGKLVSLIFPHRRVLTVLSAASYTILAILIAAAVINNPHSLNPSAVMTFIFIAVSCILDS